VVVVDACLDMLITAWKEGFAWEGDVITAGNSDSHKCLSLNSKIAYNRYLSILEMTARAY
jgi:hypothetical protein